MRTIVLVASAAILFSCLAVPLVTNTVPVESDLGRYHLPLRDFYQRCLRQGDDPAWCPQLFCGYDCHGEGQAGMDHPWHRLLYSTLPLTPAFNLEIFCNYPLLFLGSLLWLGRHGLSTEAVWAGALTATFSGYTLPHWPHTNAVAVIAHIPWLLWLTDVLWRSKSPRARAAAGLGISLATGSQILLGYPQYVYFSGLAEGAYVLCLLTGAWRPVPRWVIAKLLGVAIGAAQLLPSMQAASLSSRPAYDPHFQAMLSLPPSMLLQLVAPSRFNEFMQLHEYTVYGGALATIGCLWLFIHRQSSWPRSTLGRWALIMVLLAVPLALGRHTPLWKLYLKIPILGLFRCPCRYLVLSHLAAAVVVAFFVDDLVARERSSPRRLAWLLAIPAAAWLLAGNWWTAFVSPDSRVFLVAGGMTGAGVLTAATGLTGLAARGRSVALPLLLGLGMADLGHWGFRAIRVYTFVDLPTLIARETAPPGAPNGRVVIGDIHGDTLMLRGWSYTNGYVGLTPPRKLDYSTERVQQLAGTTWRHDGTVWTAVPGLPRIRFASQVAPPVVELDRPGRIAIMTRSEQPDDLIVAESWHPDWRVTIDGLPAELRRFEQDFLMVTVPSGDHRVEFRFDPVRRTLGRWVSAAGLTAAIGLALWCGFRPRVR